MSLWVITAICITMALGLFGWALVMARQPLRDISNIRRAVQFSMIDVVEKVPAQDRTTAYREKLAADIYALLEEAISSVDAAMSPPTAKDVLRKLRTDMVNTIGSVGQLPKDGEDTKSAIVKAMKTYKLSISAPGTVQPYHEKRANWLAAASVGMGVLSLLLFWTVSASSSSSATKARDAMGNLISSFAAYASFESQARDYQARALKDEGWLKEVADERTKKQIMDEVTQYRKRAQELNERAESAALDAKKAMDQAEQSYPSGELNEIRLKWETIHPTK